MQTTHVPDNKHKERTYCFPKEDEFYERYTAGLREHLPRKWNTDDNEAKWTRGTIVDKLEKLCDSKFHNCYVKASDIGALSAWVTYAMHNCTDMSIQRDECRERLTQHYKAFVKAIKQAANDSSHKTCR